LSDFDVPHRFVTSYVWVLPRLANAPGILRWTIGGWETSGIWTIQSGRPFSVMSGVDNAFSGINSDRADLVGNPDLPDDRPKQEWLNEYFNTSAFAPNAPGTFGTAPRSFLRGPRYFNVDMAVMKNFRFMERYEFQFRTEFFNAFNRANFGNPYNVQRVSSRFGKIESADDPRILQFALKFSL
jgi:hypothetical protein